MTGIEDVKSQKILYHLTKFENLDSILKFGLLPRNVLLKQDKIFNDIADPNIISKRAGLANYVPFHFHPYSAFDMAVKSKHDGQTMIYICINREYAKNNGFYVLPRHPLSDENIQLFNYDDGFNKIDWDTMKTKNRTDNYAKEVKMAECLTKTRIPANCFACIFVPSEEIKNEVEKKLKQNGIYPPFAVLVQKKWFNISGR